MISTLTFGTGTNAIKTGITQNGVKIPNPSSYSVTLSDVDLNSQRASNGVLNRNRVRSNIYSVQCGWDWLSDDELDKLLGAIADAKFSLTFRDPLHKLTTQSGSGYTTAYVYASGDKQCELVTTQNEQVDYWRFSVTFIEY